MTDPGRPREGAFTEAEGDASPGYSFALLLRPDGVVLASNEAAAKRLRMPLEALVGRRVFDLFPEKTARARQEMVESTVRVRRTQSFEDVSRSGNILNIDVHPVFDAAGEVGCVAVFLTDVTEQRRIGHDRLRMATAIEQALEAVVIFDHDFTVHSVNQAFEEMTGYSQSEARGKPVEMLYVGEHQRKSLDIIRRALAEEEVWTGRVFNTCKNGRVIQVEKTMSPIRGQRGAVLGWVSVWRDVTHVAVLEKQLRQAQKMEAIGTLAGGVAHDFNNILGPVILHAELGRTLVPEDSPAALSFSEILEAANRARALVDQILSLSRRHESDDPAPFRLSSIFKECVKFLRPSLPATIEIVEDLLTDDDTILADPTQVHQVVMNLATNAAHAMRESGGVLTLALQRVDLDEPMRSLFPAAQPGPYVMLTVKDTGRGMPPEYLERVFDPFFTTKKTSGTGLGLAVVHNIVSRHGGAVRVESELGRGSAFHVLWPRTEPVQAPIVEAPAVEPGAGRGRVLFVDDEAALRKSTSLILKQLGYEVRCCSGALEALEILERGNWEPGVVLTDVTMPGMTGLDLARSVLGGRPGLPVILTSGYSDLVNPEKARELGVGYLKKPFNTRTLDAAVREALAGRASGTED
ncbi:hybrid sensor histidine kinase/response regulator [Desulfocurvus sp. DL9XJH121]